MNERIAVVRRSGVAWVPNLAEPIRAMGLQSVLLTPQMDERTEAYLAPLFDQVRVISDCGDVQALTRVLGELRDEPDGLAAVVTTEDGIIATTASAAELAGVGRTPAQPLATARNKYLTRVLLAQRGLPGPRFAVLCAPDDVSEVADVVGFPAVLKPMNGAGGHLVQVVRSPSELHEAWRHASERARHGQLAALYDEVVHLPDGRDVHLTDAFLVESFIEGHEYSVDLSVRQGVIEHIAVADKAILDEKFFECGFVSPPLDADDAVVARLLDAVDDAVRALGFDNTIAHVEVRDDGPGRVVVIEVNAGRPGGQLLGQLFEMNTGINTAAELVSVAAGLPSARTPPALPMPLASLTKYADHSGRLVAINGLEEVGSLPDVVAVIPTVRVGDLISAEFEVFAVNLIAAGFLDLDDLLETYEQATALIELVVEPE